MKIKSKTPITFAQAARILGTWRREAHRQMIASIPFDVLAQHDAPEARWIRLVNMTVDLVAAVRNRYA